MIESLDIYLGEKHNYRQYLEALARVKTKEEKEKVTFKKFFFYLKKLKKIFLFKNLKKFLCVKIKQDEKHPVLVALNDISGEEYVLDTLRKIKSSEIETTMLVLDFEYVKELLHLLCYFLKRNLEPELCLRCAVFLLK